MKPTKCSHQFVDGAGAMGDAYKCILCGHSKYPEALSRWDRKCLRKNGVILSEDVTWRGSNDERRVKAKTDAQ